MKTKNYFLSLLLATMMCASFTVSAQVTIGSVEIPQAMLDIRAYPEMPERGQGFRLIDGNHTVPGRVLTLGEDGFGTWETVGLTIQRATMNPLPSNEWMLIRDYRPGSVFVTPSYIDLPPGVHMILSYMPVRFNFNTEAFETITYALFLVGENSTHRLPVIRNHGTMRGNVHIRELKMATIDLSANTSITRFYIGIGDFAYHNASGSNVIATHPNAGDNSFQFIYQGLTAQLLAIPLAQ